jgi:pyruvate dehydrogenase E2 component (dihydrolipoamide acetyltransferase)
MAERMDLAWRTIPHVTTFEQVDAAQLIEMRRQIQPAAEQRGVSLTYLPFIVKAVVAALKANPIFNSSLDEKTREVVYKRYYHIGLATATPDGLVVAVVRDADKLSLSQLGAEIVRLAEGGRNRSLKPHELSGSTFTISNYGSYGGGMGTPIINPPEVAILGVGRIKDEVVARNGQPVVRPMLPLNLSFDHRLIDGATSGQFMQVLMELLENPARLMLDLV